MEIAHAGVVLPAGGFDQEKAGETLSPTQFGFCLLLPAILVASRSPSLNDDDVIVKAPCAAAFWLLPARASAMTAERTLSASSEARHSAAVSLKAMLHVSVRSQRASRVSPIERSKARIVQP